MTVGDVMQNNLEINWTDRELLRNFFITVYDWMLNHINPSKEDLKEFINMYTIFINDNNLNDNPILKLFLFELKNDLLTKKENEIGIIKNHYQIIKSPLFMQNKVILKWYRESKLERHLFNYTKERKR